MHIAPTERLTTILFRLAASVMLLSGGPLGALRALFAPLLHKDTNIPEHLMGLSVNPEVPPVVREAAAAGLRELTYREPAGWTPQHLAAAFQEHVPALFRRPQGDKGNGKNPGESSTPATT